jgi:2-polyprenyl-3-methyl-5-hydroxy-6-metoxy-1,4-benzoquinol methylase
MISLGKQAIEKVVLPLRRSRLRQPILKKLLAGDNLLRRWITFFSLERGLHPKHRLTHYHDFFLDNIRPTDTVLDIGCGLGFLACDAAAKASQVVGIDMDQTYHRYAREHCHRPNVEFILGDATHYDFKKDFDVVILSNVLEHIQDRIGMLRRLAPLAPTLLIRVPMIDRDWIVLLKKELGIDYRLDPTHVIEYTEHQFRREIAAAGLSIEKLEIRFGELYTIIHRP